MNILVVDDEPLVADFVRRGLTAEGHQITVVGTGIDAQGHAMAGGYDLMLLDITLPDKMGFDVCEQLRGAGVSIPIIMLTARDSVDERIRGLRAGADDYVVKPYAFEELLARIESVVRRRTRTLLDHELQVLNCGSLTLDKQAKRVSCAGRQIELTAKEFGILELLLRRTGAVISREQILNGVWSVHADPLTNIVEVYVGRLRRKLAEADAPLIETVRGFGYRIG
jgi:DNA-binding response OmpR family regulator